MASAQLAGDGPTVIAAAEKLGKLIPDEAARGIAMVQPVKAAPYFAHAQFSSAETILALPDPGDAVPYVKALWLYARGVALTTQGDFAGATAAADAIETLEHTSDFKLLKESNIPAQEVLRIARAVVLARVAQAKGDKQAAIAGFERAAESARRPALHRTTLLVLSNPAIHGGSSASGRPDRRGEATVRACASLRTGQSAGRTTAWLNS